MTSTIMQQLEEGKRRSALVAANVHPAYQAMANCYDVVSDADVTALVLQAITAIAQGKPETVKAELRTIYAAVRSQGGDAYAAHKARLQAIQDGPEAEPAPRPYRADPNNPYDNGEIELAPAQYRTGRGW